MKQSGPNFNMRVEEPTKRTWLEAMKKDGFFKLATWIKWVIELHIRRQ